MENFEEALVEMLKAKPGVTRQRLAEAMGVAYDDDYLTRLDAAIDKKIIHKVQDKYYPGKFSAY